MSVNFKFDQRKFERAIKEQATSALNKQKYDVTCPHCAQKIKVTTGKSVCPYCHKEIDLTLDISFEG